MKASRSFKRLSHEDGAVHLTAARLDTPDASRGNIQVAAGETGGRAVAKPQARGRAPSINVPSDSSRGIRFLCARGRLSFAEMGSVVAGWKSHIHWTAGLNGWRQHQRRRRSRPGGPRQDRLEVDERRILVDDHAAGAGFDAPGPAAPPTPFSVWMRPGARAIHGSSQCAAASKTATAATRPGSRSVFGHAAAGGAAAVQFDCAFGAGKAAGRAHAVQAGGHGGVAELLNRAAGVA